MKTQFSTVGAKALVSILALSMASSGASMAAAQPPPPPSGPPPGSYAPPPPGYENSGAVYDAQAQQADRDYADQYSRWAAKNCVDRKNNKAAGAVIGGVLGAILGSNTSRRRDRTGAVIAGGALGAVAGAAVAGGDRPSAACPPGYQIRARAEPFAYGGPPPPPGVLYGPDWYQPWVFVNSRWVYRPYRYWYWNNPTYWRPDYHAGNWSYRYRRW